GAGFFIKVVSDEMPHDGYQYMDDEITYGYPKDPRMIIKERSQGFQASDQFTHIIRRKYTLVQPGRETLALLHYSRADDSRAVVVDARRAKTPARNYPLKQIPGLGAPPPTQQIQQQQQQPGAFRPGYPQQPQHPQMKALPGFNPAKVPAPYAGAPVAGSPASPQQQGYPRFNPGAIPPQPGQVPGQPAHRLSSTNNAAYGSQRHEKKSSHKKHSQQQQLTPQAQAQLLAQQQVQAQEDAEEPSGDELDFLTAKDVAIARYKRNHDYIAEVFSPYPTSRIVPTKADYADSLSYLKEQNSKSGRDSLEDLETEHDEKIKRFKAEASVFYKGLDDLKQATTVQEVFAANEKVESFLDMTVQPYLFLRQISLPKEQLAPTPELKPAKIIQNLPVAQDIVMESTPAKSLVEKIAADAMAVDVVAEPNSMVSAGMTPAPVTPAPVTPTPIIPAPVTLAPIAITSTTSAPLTHENIAEVNAQSGAPIAVGPTSVTTTTMEVDSTAVNPPESVNGVMMLEDTEMTNAENNFMNDMLNTNQSPEMSVQSTPAPGSFNITEASAAPVASLQSETPVVVQTAQPTIENEPSALIMETHTPNLEQPAQVAVESGSSTLMMETSAPIVEQPAQVTIESGSSTLMMETNVPIVEHPAQATIESEPSALMKETVTAIEPQSTPIIENNANAVEDTPVAEQNTSVMGSSAPVAEEITPASTVTPAPESNTPVVSIEMPTVVQSVPVVPVAESSASVAEISVSNPFSTSESPAAPPVAAATAAQPMSVAQSEPVNPAVAPVAEPDLMVAGAVEDSAPGLAPQIPVPESS
ncbi:hypothetical protein BG004_000957, partial [Podila humilis]